MTKTEYGKYIKEEYNNHIVLIRYGKFYRCFNYDAYIMHYLFSYKITSKDSIGFPKENISNILLVLKKNNISSIVIENTGDYIIYNSLENLYDEVLKKSLSFYNKEESKNILYEIISKKLDNNYSLIYKIRDYIDKL